MRDPRLSINRGGQGVTLRGVSHGFPRMIELSGRSVHIIDEIGAGKIHLRGGSLVLYPIQVRNRPLGFLAV